jgi:2-hydroxychromene-2-carboxylate isomerase
MIGPSRVWHWYDFACPYSYVAQDNNAILRRLGLSPDLLPYSVRTQGEPAEALGRVRESPTHQRLERAARIAGLTLRWPRRVPHTRDALCVAEWVRQYQPDLFDRFHRRVFAAHFAMGEDIGDLDRIYAFADQAGVDIAGVRTAMADGSAEMAVVASESAARREGVTAPPAWLIGDRLITEWTERSTFEQAAHRQLCAIGTAKSGRPLSRE